MQEALLLSSCIPRVSGFTIYLDSLHTAHLAGTCGERTPPRVASVPFHMQPKRTAESGGATHSNLSRLSYLYPVIYF